MALTAPFMSAHHYLLGYSTISVGSLEENKPRQGFTESTEPSPQSPDRGGLNDFVGSKTANCSVLAWFVNSFLARSRVADCERFDSVASASVHWISAVIQPWIQRA